MTSHVTLVMGRIFSRCTSCRKTIVLTTTVNCIVRLCVRFSNYVSVVVKDKGLFNVYLPRGFQRPFYTGGPSRF